MLLPLFVKTALAETPTRPKKHKKKIKKGKPVIRNRMARMSQATKGENSPQAKTPKLLSRKYSPIRLLSLRFLSAMVY